MKAVLYTEAAHPLCPIDQFDLALDLIRTAEIALWAESAFSPEDAEPVRNALAHGIKQLMILRPVLNELQ